MPGGRSLLLVAVVVALAATTGAAWLHEVRPRPVVQPAAQTVSTRAEKPQPPALTADEERFAFVAKENRYLFRIMPLAHGARSTASHECALVCSARRSVSPPRRLTAAETEG